MKKLLFIIGIGFTTLLSAQQKPENLTFTHKLVYELDREQKEIPGTVIARELILYVADKSMILETNNATFLFKDGNLSSVVLGAFDNQVHFLPQSGFEPGLLGFKLATQTAQISTKNQCTWYKLQLFETNREDDPIDVCEICIDTQNKKDNTSMIAPHSVKGLIKEIQIIGEPYSWTLVKEETINKTFLYDKEAIKAQKQAYDKQMEERYGYQPSDSIEVDPPQTIDMPYHNEAYAYDPLYYPTFSGIDMNASYKLIIYAERIHNIMNDQINNLKEYGGDGFNRNQIIRFLKKHYESSVKNLLKAKIISKKESKQLKGIFKDFIKKAQAFNPKSVPTPEQTAYEDYDSEVWEEKSEDTKYTSTYKDLEITEDIALALDTFSDEDDMLAYTPSYCKAYQSKAPKFENEKLKLHLTNYLGQLCDLYLYPYTYSVDFKGTIDSLRKSWLEIEKLRPTLSKQDAQLLLEVMESLD